MPKGAIVMRKGTSGLLFTQNDNGSIRVEVVDYGVSEFGGGDWESWYELDKQNADALYSELSKLQSGSFKDMLNAQFGVDTEFGRDFDIPKFTAFCNERGIEYSHFTWS